MNHSGCCSFFFYVTCPFRHGSLQFTEVFFITLIHLWLFIIHICQCSIHANPLNRLFPTLPTNSLHDVSHKFQLFPPPTIKNIFSLKFSHCSHVQLMIFSIFTDRIISVALNLFIYVKIIQLSLPYRWSDII